MEDTTAAKIRQTIAIVRNLSDQVADAASDVAVILAALDKEFGEGSAPDNGRDSRGGIGDRVKVEVVKGG